MNELLKLKKDIINILFIFNQINPCVTGIIINENKSIAMAKTGQQRSRALNIRVNKLKGSNTFMLN